MGSLDTVRDAYGAAAAAYISAVGSIDDVDDRDLALVSEWARGADGPVVDAGCGPGQWTRHLAGLGVDVTGVDPVPEFLAAAVAADPRGRYRLGRAEELGAADGELGGVLAWYSLIHLPPEEMAGVLAEFARCVAPGGGLLLGFFTADRQSRFDHAVCPAYYWPVELLAARVAAAGFRVVRTETRTDRPERSHGALVAVRNNADDVK
ncbi:MULTISPECIES: class I SAM-dependent methyltransferase [unclassified Gordonia (in: high G+C Gram-positive bacteria)]|uniref:class I SAM-dependent methyltransferase n=1 Tax=unclassified Gordonia (in: high G+C Gram-positive bacteria) TaxID=2657482 RepID=UPI001FFFA7BF|nr:MULTISPECIES: class I SAM-dependent methyltransferase [unclassified Gordonia (in: high G+C Gram-positive bacteria)]UQE74288.1 class I SAM-dependent methyltransferase [Gordonia sp. PP30]